MGIYQLQGRKISQSRLHKDLKRDRLRREHDGRFSQRAVLRHRVVHESLRKGPWRNLVTPYSVGITDAAFYPSMRVESIIKCPQSGATEAVHNCVGYTIDRPPGPVLYVYPDEATARENARDRIIPMLRSSPRLREYLTGTSDGMGSLRIKMSHLTIYMAWSGSAARLGNKPIRYLMLDELDKYQGT